MASLGQKVHGVPSDVTGTRFIGEGPPPRFRCVRLYRSAV